MFKDSKSVIIAALLVVVLAMAVGYAAFSTQLTVNGNAEITGDWNVEITGIKATSTVGAAVAGTPTFTKTSATFDTDLKKPGDAVTYTITIENKGSIDAKLNTATWTPQADGSPAIVYTYTDPSETLAAGATTTCTVTATYDAATETVPAVTTKTITALFEYIQAE